MRARAVVRIQFRDAQAAEAVARATSVDNPRADTQQRVAQRTVEFSAQATSLGSLRETLDDWLRCATAAAEAARRVR